MKAQLPSTCKTKYFSCTKSSHQNKLSPENLSKPKIIYYYQHSKHTPKRSKSLTGQATFRQQNTSDYFVPKRWKTIIAFIAALAFSQIAIGIYKADEPHSSVFALQEHHSFPFPLHTLSSFKENTNTDFRSTIPSITTRKLKFLSASLRGFFFSGSLNMSFSLFQPPTE